MGRTDQNGDQTVTVEEIIMAVNNALTGCRPPASPTPTPPQADGHVQRKPDAAAHGL
ncbi:MAG TPA: hypothetical protein VMW56_15670 [Candidatus Margulisiibacteriota bacterium]|nr:hypothetical protein [Candidatus Margulisiibacteriota bacterium]